MATTGSRSRVTDGGVTVEPQDRTNLPPPLEEVRVAATTRRRYVLPARARTRRGATPWATRGTARSCVR